VARDNIAVCREMSDVFNRRDVEALLELLDPAVVWIPIMAVLEGRVYRGHDDVRKWVEQLSTDWEVFETHQEEFREIGDRVLILGRWRARARVSGVELEEQPATWLVDMRDGKIVRLQTFTDRQEALAAAGVDDVEVAGRGE
jgi:ketosteroid isomerase-like protein